MILGVNILHARFMEFKLIYNLIYLAYSVININTIPGAYGTCHFLNPSVGDVFSHGSLHEQ
jgi:hypothetical protein